MIPSEQSRLLLRKASQDKAVLEKLLDDPAIDDEILGYHAQQAAEKLLKALLAQGGHNYPRSHNIGLLLDLLEDHGRPLPEHFQAVEALTPFGTVFRYDDLPLEDSPDRRTWPPLIAALFLYVEGVINASDDPAEVTSA
jgi:HEPN domain-containing protein